MTDLNCLASVSKLIAMQVRNELEDFHVQHLSDDQMRQLNPLIRDAIYSALVLMTQAGDPSNPRRCRSAIAGLNFLLMSIPSYWEAPELIEGVKQLLNSPVGQHLPEQEMNKLSQVFREYLSL